MQNILILLAIYILLNIVSLFAFALDKRKAAKGKWRTPEKKLLLLSFLGPFGAAFGMKMFRHKTMKLKFKLVYVFLALHIVVICAIVMFLADLI